MTEGMHSPLLFNGQLGDPSLRGALKEKPPKRCSPSFLFHEKLSDPPGPTFIIS